MIFFLLPVYTYFLSPEQLGEADLVVATVMLFVPIVSLSMADAVLRFCMDAEPADKVLNSAMVVIYLLFLLLIVSSPFSKYFPLIHTYYSYFALLFFFQSLFSIFQQYIRAIGESKLFALSSIVSAIMLVTSMIVCLNYFSMGIEGFLLAQIISVIIGTLFLLIFGKIKIKITNVDFYLLKKMLAYSVPLIPNALTWWIMQLSNRFIINFFLGALYSGMYAVAVKLPSVINLIGSIFFQAWQLSILEEKNDREEYSRKVFLAFSVFLFIVISSFIAGTKVLSDVLFSSAYSSVWKFIPFLFISSLFSSLAAFIATNYLVNKNTKFIFSTTLLGAIVNLVFSFILIPTMGLQGSSIAAMISFFATFVVRLWDSKLFTGVEFKVSYSFSIIILILQACALNFNWVTSFWGQCLFVLVIVLINVPVLVSFIKSWEISLIKKELIE